MACAHSSCSLSSLKGLVRGLTYGAKIRFTHSIVMAILFGKGTLHKRLRTILKNTSKHSLYLGMYVFTYKTAQCFLNRALSYKQSLHSLFAGALGGFFIFSKETSINSQITLYLLSRIITAGTTLLYRTKTLPQAPFLANNSFVILTSLSWAIVMYLFEKDPSVLQSSLAASMQYLYNDTDKWTTLTDFIPFGDSIKSLAALIK